MSCLDALSNQYHVAEAVHVPKTVVFFLSDIPVRKVGHLGLNGWGGWAWGGGGRDPSVAH